MLSEVRGHFQRAPLDYLSKSAVGTPLIIGNSQGKTRQVGRHPDGGPISSRDVFNGDSWIVKYRFSSDYRPIYAAILYPNRIGSALRLLGVGVEDRPQLEQYETGGVQHSSDRSRERMAGKRTRQLNLASIVAVRRTIHVDRSRAVICMPEKDGVDGVGNPYQGPGQPDCLRKSLARPAACRNPKNGS